MEKILKKEYVYELRGDKIDMVCDNWGSPVSIIADTICGIEAFRNGRFDVVVRAKMMNRNNSAATYIEIIANENINDAVKEFCLAADLTAIVKIKTTTVYEKHEELA